MPTGPFTVSGNALLDNGAAVQLKGINRNGLNGSDENLAGPNAPLIWQFEVDHAYQSAAPQSAPNPLLPGWRCSVIRVPLSDRIWLNGWSSAGFATGASFQTYLDSVVSWITGHGMVALLDLHYSMRDPNQSPVGTELFLSKMAGPSAAIFWTQVANRYKSNPLVMFDLFNEPHDISNAVWLNGGTLNDADLGNWTATGMQALYDAVRATGATNVCVISGNAWAADPTPWLDGHAVVGTNIVAGQHYYPCGGYGPGATSACIDNPDNWTAHPDPGWLTLAASRPIFVTEFGWPRVAQQTYTIYTNWTEYFGSQSPPWSWTCWAWYGEGGDGYLDLLYDETNWVPTAGGAAIIDALAKAPTLQFAPNTLNFHGVAPQPLTPALSFQVRNSGKMFLRVTASAGNALAISFAPQVRIDTDFHAVGTFLEALALLNTVPAGQTLLYGPFNPAIYNNADGCLEIAIDTVAHVQSIEAIQLP